MSNSTSDDTPRPVKASLEEMRRIRDEFAKSIEPMHRTLDQMNRQIAKAEEDAREEARQTAVRAYMPGDDINVWGGHDFLFYVNNSKDAGHGPESVIGAAVAAAHTLRTTAMVAGVKGSDVTTRFWGGKQTAEMKLDGKFGAAAYNTTNTAAHDFIPAAKEILNANTPDHVSGKQKHYIITGNGDIADNIEHAARILEAAAAFNPRATFDFVVCSTKDNTSVEALAKRLPGVTVTKVSTPAEMADAIKNIVKDCLTPAPYPRGYTGPRPA